jgi:hypothetical protein
MMGWSKNYVRGNRYQQDWQEAQKARCENDIREDLRTVKTNNWTKCNQDRFKWKEVFEKASTVKQ